MDAKTLYHKNLTILPDFEILYWAYIRDLAYVWDPASMKKDLLFPMLILETRIMFKTQLVLRIHGIETVLKAEKMMKRIWQNSVLLKLLGTFIS